MAKSWPEGHGSSQQVLIDFEDRYLILEWVETEWKELA